MSKTFRLATVEDQSVIYQILCDAKQQLKESGSSQWQSGEPSLSTLISDINKGTCYVVDDGGICATLNVSLEEDIPYRNVYGGQWSVDASYITLHRIAIKNNAQGKNLMKFILDRVVLLALENDRYQIRVDTYIKNIKMINSLQRYGFKRIGIIHVKDPLDPAREAFEYLIETLP